MSLRYFGHESIPPLALPYPMALLYGTAAGLPSLADDTPRPDSNTPPAEPGLTGVKAELIARELIFHRLESGTDTQAVEEMIAEDFIEIGASGRRYGRRSVINTLLERSARPIDDDWSTSDFQCLEIAPDTYLLTYQLVQEGARRSRRATIWRRAATGWKAVYHQGTLIQND